jgi:hypothetical protein
LSRLNLPTLKVGKEAASLICGAPNGRYSIFKDQKHTIKNIN